MRDTVVINAFAKMDHAGELDDIKQLLDPNRPKRNDRFIDEIQSYVADIIGFCSALAIVTKAATGAVGAVALAKKLIDWVKKRLASIPELPKDLGLRERLLVLLFEATVNRGEGLSSEKLKQLLACSTEEFDEAIAGPQQFGVARISIDGDRKYAQPREWVIRRRSVQLINLRKRPMFSRRGASCGAGAGCHRAAEPLGLTPFGASKKTCGRVSRPAGRGNPCWLAVTSPWGGIILVNLAGVGVARDAYRQVTQDYIRNQAQAVILTVDQSEPTAEAVDLLKTSGYWARLVGATDDPGADPCKLFIAVTRVDDVATADYMKRPAGDAPRPPKHEVYAEVVEKFISQMPAQIVGN